MRPLIAGNWKMNMTKTAGTALARDLGLRYAEQAERDYDLLVCPPATLIDAVGQVLAGSGVFVGGQDCHAAEDGAYTGEIAAGMLADLGCTHVIVGHSERRQYHGELDLLIGAGRRHGGADRDHLHRRDRSGARRGRHAGGVIAANRGVCAEHRDAGQYGHRL